jgi:hypothetical protein
VEVVGFAMAGGSATAGEAAAAVAVGHGAALGAVEEAFAVAEVEDRAVLVDEDAADDAVAAHAPDRVDRHGQTRIGLAEAGFDAGECGFGDDDADVRFGVAAVVRTGEGAPADLDASARSCSRVRRSPSACPAWRSRSMAFMTMLYESVS